MAHDDNQRGDRGSHRTDMTTANKKPRGKGKPFVKGDDPRRNKGGRPSAGTSFRDVWGEEIDRYAEDIAKDCEAQGRNDLALAFKQMPKGVPLKRLIGWRVMAAIMFDPTSGLVTAFVDRIDGKVKDEIEHTGKVEITGFAETLDKVYGKPKSK